MRSAWPEVTVRMFVVVVVLMIAAFTYAGCAADAPYPPIIRKLNEAGTVWYVSDYENDDPTKFVGRTCATVGLVVTDVKLADRDAAEATVTCAQASTPTP